MKKTLSIFVVLIAISSAVSARRMDKPEEATSMAVTKSGSLVKLFYKGAKDCNVRVIISNAKNQVVFEETIKHVDGFMRPYNFSNLEEGDYTVELIDHTGKKVETIAYRNRKVEQLANLIRISREEDKYLLTVPNKGENIFDVSIYDSFGALLYSHSEKADGDFAKVYNLSKISKKFVFVITDKSGSSKQIEYWAEHLIM
jgi:hypothetical protein